MLGYQQWDFMFFLFIWHSGSEAKLYENGAHNCIHTPCLVHYMDDQRGFPKSEDTQDPYSIKFVHQHECQDGDD